MFSFIIFVFICMCGESQKNILASSMSSFDSGTLLPFDVKYILYFFSIGTKQFMNSFDSSSSASMLVIHSVDTFFIKKFLASGRESLLLVYTLIFSLLMRSISSFIEMLFASISNTQILSIPFILHDSTHFIIVLLLL